MEGWKGFWEGKIDEKLDDLYDKYDDIFGVFPDGYFDLDYSFSYDEFCEAIEKSLKNHKEIHYNLPRKYWLDT